MEPWRQRPHFSGFGVNGGGDGGREAETVPLKSLPLKGMKKPVQALDGGAPEPVCTPGSVLEAARREQSREMQGGRRKGARKAVLPVSQHRQGLTKEIATAYIMIRIT